MGDAQDLGYAYGVTLNSYIRTWMGLGSLLVGIILVWRVTDSQTTILDMSAFAVKVRDVGNFERENL